ncbi:MAG TPA: substrate-binding domain-containing protein [Bacteroidota bacterium]|nr:substrate-binding domain-containing protein [Bacteroidota bacterium]
MQRFMICFVVCVLALSCAKKEEQGATKTIGVALLTRGHIFYKDLEEGLKEEAARQHYALVVTSAEFDLGKQISQIEDFVARRVDAIIVCPVDSKGIGPGIRKANDAKIPVFTADIAAQEGNVVCHIASDNVAGGRLAGEYLAKALNGKGRIAIINNPVATSVLDRVQGFREAIAKYPGIIVAADVSGQAVRDKSLEATADVLQGNPQLDGIFGINDATALGALDAVQQFKRTNIIIVGYDATPPAADAITRGTPLKADVIQYPVKIGTMTIDMIRDHFAGKQVPAVVPVEVGIADAEYFLKNPQK